MTFKIPQHNSILIILESLDCEVLQKSCAYFGSGTLIALEFNEYRCSKDIDFICSVTFSGYRYLRTAVFEGGYQALFRNLEHIQVGRGTTDQYGIRMIVDVNGLLIKTEIIAEARFELDPPRYPDWSPVACLSLSNCFTSKLLANCDRYLDDSVESRDLIDLAVLRLHSFIPQVAVDKAEKAYEVIRPLTKAIERFQKRVDYRQKCFSGLQIDNSQIPKIIDGIDLLASDLGLNITPRVFKEQHDIFADFDT